MCDHRGDYPGQADQHPTPTGDGGERARSLHGLTDVAEVVEGVLVHRSGFRHQRNGTAKRFMRSGSTTIRLRVQSEVVPHSCPVPHWPFCSLLWPPHRFRALFSTGSSPPPALSSAPTW